MQIYDFLNVILKVFHLEAKFSRIPRMYYKYFSEKDDIDIIIFQYSVVTIC